jgi:hypothetical protein
MRSVERTAVDEAVLKNLGVGSEDLLQLVEALLQFPAIAGPQPRLFPFAVLARD